MQPTGMIGEEGTIGQRHGGGAILLRSRDQEVIPDSEDSESSI
jgi:hypothetical protein